MRERGLTVGHVTIFRWVQRYAPEINRRMRPHLKMSGTSTVFGLIHKEAMVKPPNEILRDDCYSYARRSPYQRLTTIPSKLRDILDLSKNRADLITPAEEVSQRFVDLAAKMTEALLSARSAGEERNVGTPDNFNEVWEWLSMTMIEGLLSNLPRQIRRLCKKHGLKNMLKIKSIRLYTIYYAWLIPSGWFGVEGDPRKMKEGDVGDFFHAVQASVANIFVTQENKDRRDKLPFILNQVSTTGFAIMSLNEFIESLRHKTGVAHPAEA